MPAYTSSPFANVSMLTPGTPFYVWGSFNDRVAPTRMSISNVALTTNVATLTVQLLEGDIPAVGSLISVQGTQSTSGLFNVTQVALAGVSMNATTGAGVVTFALTHANVVAAANTGFAIVQTPTVFEAVTAATASQAVAVPTPSMGRSLQGFSVEASWDAAPSAAVVSLQIADINQDSAFVTADNMTFSGTLTTLRLDPAGLSAQFIRLYLASHTGTENLAGRILLR